jgi:hypothetical protein
MTLEKEIQKAKKLFNTYRKDEIERLKDKLEEVRLLSVKEPMYLSDRINLNGTIREIQSLFSYLL